MESLIGVEIFKYTINKPSLSLKISNHVFSIIDSLKLSDGCYFCYYGFFKKEEGL